MAFGFFPPLLSPSSSAGLIPLIPKLKWRRRKKNRFPARQHQHELIQEEGEGGFWSKSLTDDAAADAFPGEGGEIWISPSFPLTQKSAAVCCQADPTGGKKEKRFPFPKYSSAEKKKILFENYIVSLFPMDVIENARVKEQTGHNSFL